MDFVLRILRKHLVNEYAWLRMESRSEWEKKYAVGAELAKKRIPQLEEAIKILGDYKATHYTPDPQPSQEPSEGGETENQFQLPLFNF